MQEARFWCSACGMVRNEGKPGRCEVCGEGLMVLDENGVIVGAAVQMWYCERCGERINDHRFQCVGCEGWFCEADVSAFTADGGRVCESCLGIWEALCKVRGIPSYLGGSKQLQGERFFH